MAAVALAIFFLLAVAIYSLSRLNAPPWTSPVKPVTIAVDPTMTEQAADVPEFSSNDNGKVISRETLKERWTLISFWSYSCPPCLVEMPDLNQMALNIQDPRFDVLTVNIDEQGSENLEQARKFMVEQQILLPTIYDSKGILKAAFKVTEYPKHFLVNPQLKIVWQATGSFAWTDSHADEQFLKLMEQQQALPADQDREE
jgi:thiol-disulfide isomerase/thioredoxin